MIDRDRPDNRLKPNGSGDITETHIEWKETKRMPPRASPIIIKGLLLLSTETVTYHASKQKQENQYGKKE